MNYQLIFRPLYLVSIVFGICPIFDCVIAQDKNESTSNIIPLVQLGRIEPEMIHESSGLALCGSRKDAIWTVNDSGNANEVYLLSTTGKLLATVRLGNAPNVDWEAMCSGTIKGKRHLIVGDVGDNRANRRACFLYVFPEPNLSGIMPVTSKINPAKIEFKYSDGPRNCEAISFNELTDEIWLIEKRYVDDKRTDQPGVYTLPIQTKSTTVPLLAKRIGDYPVRNVTGMAFSPDGTRLIIRNYLNAHIYQRLTGQTWQQVVVGQRPKTIALPIQRQGEAVCFASDSHSIILTSEIKRQPIWQVNLDAQLGPPHESNPNKTQFDH